jgi:hypothetical protein
MAKRKTKIKVEKAEAAERVKKIYPILTKAYPKATTALRSIRQSFGAFGCDDIERTVH